MCVRYVGEKGERDDEAKGFNHLRVFLWVCVVDAMHRCMCVCVRRASCPPNDRFVLVAFMGLELSFGTRHGVAASQCPKAQVGDELAHTTRDELS